MEMIRLPEVDIGDEITAYEDYPEFALFITFPRKRRIFLDRANHFEMYGDSEFFNHFCLSNTTVHCI